MKTTTSNKLMRNEEQKISASELKKAHLNVLGNISQSTMQKCLQKELCLTKTACLEKKEDKSNQPCT